MNVWKILVWTRYLSRIDLTWDFFISHFSPIVNCFLCSNLFTNDFDYIAPTKPDLLTILCIVPVTVNWTLYQGFTFTNLSQLKIAANVLGNAPIRISLSAGAPSQKIDLVFTLDTLELLGKVMNITNFPLLAIFRVFGTIRTLTAT
jgi:hypothetical protein